MLRHSIQLLLLSLLAASSAVALDAGKRITQYGVRTWQVEDGLPQSSVNAIAQTRDGYLWFGTQEGLARFDGARFAVFDKQNTPAFAASHHINALLLARDGTLWIGRMTGLTAMKDGRFRSYSTANGLSDAFVWSLAEGADGSIWIGTYSGGLSRFHDGKFTTYGTRDGLGSSSVWTTYVARDGTLWVGTNGGGVSRFSGGRFTTITTREGLASNIVWAIHEDRAGDVWIGTNDGLNRLHDGKLTRFTTADGLSNNCVKVIREDRDGNLWIGTDGGGLNRYEHGGFTSLSVQQGLSDASVVSLFEDHEGNLWAGTASGGVDQLWTGKFVTVSRTEGLVSNLVWSVREARDGSLLVGTNDGFSRWKGGVVTSLTTAQGLSSNIVRSVLEDRRGAVWLGTADGLDRYENGKVTVYHTADGLPHDMIRTVNEDRAGTIWIGTRGGGLAYYRDGRFTIVDKKRGLPNNVIASVETEDDGSVWVATGSGVAVLKDGAIRTFGVRDGLSSDVTRSIYRDRKGAYWIGTYGGGLNRLEKGRIAHIREADGLFDDVVFAIIEDDVGYVWMSCNRGIFRCRKKELDDFADGRIKRVHSDAFSTEDGMKKTECNGGTPPAWKGSDGRIYFATNGGVAIIDPRHMPHNGVVPAVWNESAILDGAAADIASHGLTIGPGRHTLEIHYTALSFVSAKRVAFRYRMRGFSDDWIDAGNRRAAFYMNLPPGDYTFEVMGSNNDGVWSAARNPLRVHVAAAFHQTWWFYTACAAFLALAVAAVFKIRLRLLEQRERQLARRVEEQTALLSAAKQVAERAAEKNSALSLRKQLILNSAGEGIFGLDSRGVATFINPSAARMLGWSVEELVGKNLHRLVHADDAARSLPHVECAMCSDAVQPPSRMGRSAEFRRRDGATFPVEYTASTIAGEDGGPQGVVVTFRDVTEQRAIELLKDQFVSTVSHELRTPLTSIHGALGLLSSGRLGTFNQKGERMLRIAVTNTSRLSRLINDILDLERMQSGRMDLVLRAANVGDLMLQAADALQAVADEADVTLAVRALDAEITVDIDRIVQTLTNLIGNAVKFSPPGTTVCVSAEISHDAVSFRVVDEGRGVPEDMLETIFERFQQVDASDSRDKGGSGLGLAICRSIVNAHGGRIWAERGVKGSIFQFAIPLPAAAAARKSA